MTKFKNKYRIEPNRWQYWDYSAPGRYFLTVCTENRKCIYGQVVNNKMRLSEFGEIVKSEILKMPRYDKRVILDEWVIMPNHIHLLIELGDYGFDNGFCNADNVGVDKIHEFYLPKRQPKKWWHNPNHPPTIDEIKQYRKYRRKMVIPKILGKMKMLTSKQINIVQNTPGRKNWQRDYHDHVIRNNEEYHRIKNYIINNPAKWDDDKFN